MLERVRGARTICSPIEELDLGEKFDVVLLASFLVHTGDPEVRRGMLAACLRHVEDDGVVLIQREGEDYHTNVPRERVDPRGFTVRVVSAEPIGDGVDSVFVEYLFPDGEWSQTFRARPLSEEQFEEALAEAGLRVERYPTQDRTWVMAVPAVPAG
jgi:hypothetical protein